MEEELNLSIQLKTKDMFHFLMRHTYTSYSGIFGMFLSCGALILLALTFQDNTPFKNGILLLVAAAFLIINPIQLWLKAAQQVKLNPMFQKPLSYKINQDGVFVSQEEQELTIAWEDIVKLIETKKCLILYLSTVHAYIWPMEALGTEYGKVKELVKKYLNEKQCKWRNRKEKTSVH